MPIRDIRRYRHPPTQGRAFRPLAADHWEIPIPSRVQELENWRSGVSQVLIGMAEQEDFEYLCRINVGVAEPFHLPDTHLLQVGILDFAPTILPVSALIGVFTSSDTIGQEWHETLRMRLSRFFRVDDHLDLPPGDPRAGQVLYVTRYARIDYVVLS
jgi:hypothetical protein